MKTPYNTIAGQNLERLAALSDGIFSVAMTLLVLDLRVPVTEFLQNKGEIKSEQDLWALVLLPVAPRLLTYFMSFLTLGIFWLGQQTQLNHFEKSNRDLSWIHLVFLCGVSILPFSTSLLADFITYRLVLVIYWLNLLLLGVMLFLSWRYAKHANLIRADITPEIRVAAQRRIVVYQLLYFFGFLLCVINTYVSIGFIILTQLNAAIAPRFRR